MARDSDIEELTIVETPLVECPSCCPHSPILSKLRELAAANNASLDAELEAIVNEAHAHWRERVG